MKYLNKILSKIIPDRKAPVRLVVLSLVGLTLAGCSDPPFGLPQCVEADDWGNNINIEVPVFANQKFTSTGVDVQSGKDIDITVSGTIDLSPSGELYTPLNGADYNPTRHIDPTIPFWQKAEGVYWAAGEDVSITVEGTYIDRTGKEQSQGRGLYVYVDGMTNPEDPEDAVACAGVTEPYGAPGSTTAPELNSPWWFGKVVGKNESISYEAAKRYKTTLDDSVDEPIDAPYPYFFELYNNGTVGDGSGFAGKAPRCGNVWFRYARTAQRDAGGTDGDDIYKEYKDPNAVTTADEDVEDEENYDNLQMIVLSTSTVDADTGDITTMNDDNAGNVYVMRSKIGTNAKGIDRQGVHRYSPWMGHYAWLNGDNCRACAQATIIGTCAVATAASLIITFGLTAAGGAVCIASWQAGCAGTGHLEEAYGFWHDGTKANRYNELTTTTSGRHCREYYDTQDPDLNTAYWKAYLATLPKGVRDLETTPDASDIVSWYGNYRYDYGVFGQPPGNHWIDNAYDGSQSDRVLDPGVDKQNYIVAKYAIGKPVGYSLDADKSYKGILGSSAVDEDNSVAVTRGGSSGGNISKITFTVDKVINAFNFKDYFTVYLGANENNMSPIGTNKYTAIVNAGKTEITLSSPESNMLQVSESVRYAVGSPVGYSGEQDKAYRNTLSNPQTDNNNTVTVTRDGGSITELKFKLSAQIVSSSGTIKDYFNVYSGSDDNNLTKINADRYTISQLEDGTEVLLSEGDLSDNNVYLVQVMDFAQGWPDNSVYFVKAREISAANSGGYNILVADSTPGKHGQYMDMVIGSPQMTLADKTRVRLANGTYINTQCEINGSNNEEMFGEGAVCEYDYGYSNAGVGKPRQIPSYTMSGGTSVDMDLRCSVDGEPINGCKNDEYTEKGRYEGTVPKNGQLWFRINEKDPYDRSKDGNYSDNIGSYNVHIRTPKIDSWFSDALNGLIKPIRGIIFGYCRVSDNPDTPDVNESAGKYSVTERDCGEAWQPGITKRLYYKLVGGDRFCVPYNGSEYEGQGGYSQGAAGCVVNTDGEIIYESTTNNIFLDLVRALLVLYIIIYAGMFMLGMASEGGQEEFMKRIIKFGIITALISPYSWDFFSNYLFSLFVDGMDTFIAILAGQFNGVVSNVLVDPISGEAIKDVNGDVVPVGTGANLFAFADMTISRFYNMDTMLKILGLLFASPFGIVYVAIILIGLGIYAFTLIKAMVLYLIAMLAISLLLVVSPIFITMILFEKTFNYFEQWINNLISYTFQPVFVFTALAIFNVFVFSTLYYLLSYRVCWTNIFVYHWSIFDIAFFFYLPDGSHIDPYVRQVTGFSATMPIGAFMILIFLIIITSMDKFVNWMADLAARISGAPDSSLGEASGAMMSSVGKDIKGAMYGAYGAMRGGAQGGSTGAKFGSGGAKKIADGAKKGGKAGAALAAARVVGGAVTGAAGAAAGAAKGARGGKGAMQKDAGSLAQGVKKSMGFGKKDGE